MTNNLFFDEEGITFYYNPYELATYAAGPIEIHLSYQALAPFFTSEFKRFEKYGE
ncbi:RsiV family protein [uncultured Porphyromonas sp.]|uniref:RsiV family protein n=1 Tax=uncultured Porphyromonas sp. TaxID=159274 RepID=UPI00263972E9|nr:RsiV family protein [uncultured Porphyromonas sp.]